MKKVILTICFGILMFNSLIMAADKTFTSSGQILQGESWDKVYIQNNGTNVEMSGGQVNYLSIRDASYFNMYEGQINTDISMLDGSTFNIYGGIIDLSGDFAVHGSPTSLGYLNIMGGNVTAKVLKTYPTSVIEFTGGILNFDTFGISGKLNIKGGSLNVKDAYIASGYQPATVNIYGYGFNYNPIGGIYGSGLLTGYLLDNNFFSIDDLDESEFQSIHFIPEPATLALFALGSLAIPGHTREAKRALFSS